VKEFLLNTLKARLTLEQWSWLENACKQSSLGPHYSAASRKLGKSALQLTESERAALPERYRAMKLEDWGTDEAARALMLLSAERSPRAVQECYELGDTREQQSWLRSLIFLPKAEVFMPIAVDACRTNIIPLFEAIACENPYPAEYFEELNFNQMILKCLFNRIALARIIGLESRYNPELARMADHYAKELTAAGRDLPSDIGILHENI
jgi:hypothetical protein